MVHPTPKLALIVAALMLTTTPALADRAKVVSADHQGNAMSPSWSPDGRQLTYEVGHAQEKYTEIFLLNTDSGEESEIEPPAGARGGGGRFRVQRQVNHEFAWGPGGRLYAFASSGSDDDFDIYIKGVSVGIGSEQKEGGVAFSADGRYLTYTSARSGEGDLYLADIYSLEKEPVRLTSGEGLDFYGVWSPTGSSVAYTAMGDHGSNIRVIRDVSNPQDSDVALTAWKSTQIKPTFSPNGEWVAFFSNHGREDRTRFDVYLVKVAGGKPTLAARDVVPNERSGPVWTPDGLGLVVVRNDPNAGDPLVRVDLFGGREQVLATGTANNGDPTLFGRVGDRTWRLAFVSQGLRGSEEQRWRRVWITEIPASFDEGR